MFKITSRDDLRNAKRAVKELVLNALKGVPKRKLRCGSWIQYSAIEPDCIGCVCLVGAIGVVSNGGKIFSTWYNGPTVVSPLIRNGASHWVDDLVLWSLSDGFENDSPERYQSRIYFRLATPNRWQDEYHQWLYKVGQEVRYYAGYPTRLNTLRKNHSKTSILNLQEF